ncbi:hypothetical protein CHS0354_027796 [Potamilus streckersoni]|uniref:C1q domain-containing protein n=1 Tax=Potamilus streckersoni TaxID=2493646 RepID=A0AAE0W610_9BIVA|nr:hypothetical protein CHS0354_027796 [Potamilus streckersoni]
MIPMHLLLVMTICTSVGTAILLEKVGKADLDAVRIRLEEEKAKRLLLENDVEALMVQVEELKRRFSQISKDHNASSENVTSIRASIAFTATLSKDTTHIPEQTVIFNNVMVNEGNCYDSSTGRFRAPFHGLYIFSVTILKLLSTHVNLLIMKNNVEIGKVFSGTTHSDSGSVTVVTVMEKGQVAYIKQHSSEEQTIHGNNWAFFTGLLHAPYS